MSRPDITGLVGARICHDLISPIGAIGNGIELLGLTGVAPGPEMQLISDSAAGAQARVRVRASTAEALQMYAPQRKWTKAVQ